jgi:predicted alpha/beta hydrolase family esterase
MRAISDFDIFTIVGLYNAGPDHWQSHWEQTFSNIRRVQQGDWNAPVYENWADRLTEAVGSCKNPVLLIAHSLGTSLVMRWAHTANIGNIAGAFLVAPSDRDQIKDSPAQGFGSMLLKPLPFPSMVLASRNDEMVAIERAREFAKAWGSHFVDVGALGHIGSAAKLGLWPQGLVWLGQFIASLPSHSDWRS